MLYIRNFGHILSKVLPKNVAFLHKQFLMVNTECGEMRLLIYILSKTQTSEPALLLDKLVVLLHNQRLQCLINDKWQQKFLKSTFVIADM